MIELTAVSVVSTRYRRPLCRSTAAYGVLDTHCATDRAYYYTQIIGDARAPPTLLAASNFSGMAVIGTQPCSLPGSIFIDATRQMRIPTSQVEEVHNGTSTRTTSSGAFVTS